MVQLVLVLALVLAHAGPAAASAPLLFFSGAEHGSTADISASLGSPTVDASYRRSGKYSYKMASAATQVYIAFKADAASRPEMWTRQYIFIDVVAAPSRVTTGINLVHIDTASNAICRVNAQYNTDGTVTGQAFRNAGVAFGSTWAIPTKQWVRFDLHAKRNATTGLCTIDMDGVNKASVRDVDTTGSTTDALQQSFFGPPNRNGLNANVYIDDVASALSAAPAPGRVIVRKAKAGNIHVVWGDVPARAATNAASTATSQTQTAAISDPASGADFIRASDTINGVKVAAVAKITAGIAGTYNLRWRVDGSDADTAITLTTTDAYYESAVFTATRRQLQNAEMGATRGPGGTANLQVGDLWLVIDYTPAFADVMVPVKWDTAWDLSLADADAMDAYVSGRATDGFNGILVNIGDYDNQNTALGNGHSPFTGTRPTGGGCSHSVVDVSRPQESGFTHVDHMIARLNSVGMYAGVLPMTNGTSECQQLALNSNTTAYNYGSYIGNRYKNNTNIIWFVGGDTNTPATHQLLINYTKSFVDGLRDAGALQPVSWQTGGGGVGGPNSTADTWLPPDGQWLDFNSILHRLTLSSNQNDTAYLRTQSALGRHVGNAEPAYEGERGWTRLRGRQGVYRGFMAGAAFMTYGNHTSGYESCCNHKNLSGSTGSAGAMEFVRAADLMISREWLSYAVDDSFINSCTGDCTGLIRPAQGRGMVYLATSGSVVTLNLAIFNAVATVHITRMDPATGATTTVGNYATNGMQRITTDGLADALIMIDPPTR